MSIAYGGIIAFIFRGAHLAVAFALVWVTSTELGGAGRGTFILGVTAIGMVTALMNGLTAAAAYQVSNRRRHPVEVLANAAVPALRLRPSWWQGRWDEPHSAATSLRSPSRWLLARAPSS